MPSTTASSLARGWLGGEPYLVSELVDGPSCAEILSAMRARRQRLPAPVAVHLALCLLDGLAHLHELLDERGRPSGIVHRDVSPGNVFVARGVPKRPMRDHYLIWKEGKPPEVVIEVTSKSTRREDERKKSVLYRDVMKVREYFLFDPFERFPPVFGHDDLMALHHEPSANEIACAGVIVNNKNACR